MEVRAAQESEVDALARLWSAAWRDAHAALVPEELMQARTLESFRDRLAVGLPNVRATGPVGAPLGFHVTKADELYQLFVAAEARGRGVAAALIADAEARLAETGVQVAWLACAIGNERAARFYEKCGWRRCGTMDSPLELPHGQLILRVWRYERIFR